MESGGDIRLFHPDCVGCGTLDETECFKRKKHDQCCYLLFICDECIQVFFSNVKVEEKPSMQSKNRVRV